MIIFAWASWVRRGPDREGVGVADQGVRAISDRCEGRGTLDRGFTSDGGTDSETLSSAVQGMLRPRGNVAQHPPAPRTPLAPSLSPTRP
jgi:hypothetical protein